MKLRRISYLLLPPVALAAIIQMLQPWQQPTNTTKKISTKTEALPKPELAEETSIPEKTRDEKQEAERADRKNPKTDITAGVQHLLKQLDDPAFLYNTSLQKLENMDAMQQLTQNEQNAVISKAFEKVNNGEVDFDQFIYGVPITETVGSSELSPDVMKRIANSNGRLQIPRPKLVLVPRTPEQEENYEYLKAQLDNPDFIRDLTIDKLASMEEMRNLPKELWLLIMSKAQMASR